MEPGNLIPTLLGNDRVDSRPDLRRKLQYGQGSAQAALEKLSDPDHGGVGDVIALFERIVSGDDRALAELYERTSAKLFGVIKRIVTDQTEAEDVLQEVYVTIWRKAAEFDASKASPVTWMVVVARNRAIDQLRRRASRPQTATLDLVAEVRDPSPSADELIDAGTARSRLDRAFAVLDPRHQAIIRQAYFEGLQYQTLSEREGVPVGTIKSWVRRGLLRMRAVLNEQ